MSRLLPRERGPLVGVLALSGVLNVAGLWTLGYGNAYYAAAVRSMLSSWHNLWYASFDAGGFVSIDKPPVAFWLQALSARVLGFSGWALMLPSALAGVASVAVLYVLVARAWGRGAGLLAALALAVSPIAVVASRSNIVDGVLVLVLLLAALVCVRAAETGRLRWLLLAGALVGLGFNVKMLEAYLVVPALGLLYLVCSPARWWVRVAHLGAAAAVLVVVSFSWVTAVDLAPAASRPYVGSSVGDSELNLALSYNGWNRVSGSPYADRFRRAAATVPRRPQVSRAELNGFSVRETGAAGPLRLFSQPMGSQTGWLLPLAVLGLVAAVASAWRDGVRSARGRSLVLWGTWLVGEGAFFSVASTVHAYYLTMLAPAIAALAGIGLAVMWRRWPWALVAALAATALEAVWILGDFPGWRWLVPVVAGSALVAAVALLLRRPRLRVAGGLAAAVAVLAAPVTWTGYSVANTRNAALPSAGPPSGAIAGFIRRFTGGRGAGVPFGGGVDPGLLRYLVAHQGSAEYLMGTVAAMQAAPYMLATGRPALALGGFMGGDRIVDPDQLDQLVTRGVVRYFVLRAPGGGRFGGFGGFGGAANQDVVAWVAANCADVPRDQWATAPAGPRDPAAGQALYDCGIR